MHLWGIDIKKSDGLQKVDYDITGQINRNISGWINFMENIRIVTIRKLFTWVFELWMEPC